jgi:hypothetical protein
VLDLGAGDREVVSERRRPLIDVGPRRKTSFSGYRADFVPATITPSTLRWQMRR